MPKQVFCVRWKQRSAEATGSAAVTFASCCISSSSFTLCSSFRRTGRYAAQPATLASQSSLFWDWSLTSSSLYERLITPVCRCSSIGGRASITSVSSASSSSGIPTQFLKLAADTFWDILFCCSACWQTKPNDSRCPILLGQLNLRSMRFRSVLPIAFDDTASLLHASQAHFEPVLGVHLYSVWYYYSARCNTMISKCFKMSSKVACLFTQTRNQLVGFLRWFYMYERYNTNFPIQVLTQKKADIRYSILKIWMRVTSAFHFILRSYYSYHHKNTN